VALTGQPAGTVATRAAGLADFRAVLEWDAADHRPASCLPAPGGFFRQDLVQVLSPCGTQLEVRGGITALTERGLAGAVERVMRVVSGAAAVSGAVLEMRVVRESASGPTSCRRWPSTCGGPVSRCAWHPAGMPWAPKDWPSGPGVGARAYGSFCGIIPSGARRSGAGKAGAALARRAASG
jgi:hypothetical protein